MPPRPKAAQSHLWFVTFHPLDDGNGRIARAIADMALARSERSPQRFYSMSAQIRQDRKAYYDVLETTQKGSLNITPWMVWFLACLDRAIGEARSTVADILDKARFWGAIAPVPLNSRQRLMINRLLDGFEGKLTTLKWAALAKCSQDTALRDIVDLVQRGVLNRDAKAVAAPAIHSTCRALGLRNCLSLGDCRNRHLESWNLNRKLSALPGWRVRGKPL